MTYSSNTFTYSGYTYTLDISLFTEDISTAFDGKDIEQFEYSTKLNSFVVDGKVVYRDRYARVDKFMS